LSECRGEFAALLKSVYYICTQRGFFIQMKKERKKLAEYRIDWRFLSWRLHILPKVTIGLQIFVITNISSNLHIFVTFNQYTYFGRKSSFLIILGQFFEA
jgi:hypothetical protein